MLSFHRRSVGVFAVLTALCLASVPAAGQYPAENVELLRQITLQEFGPPALGAKGCWGYVSPSGREYALIALFVGTGFVEITDPANPVIVAVMDESVDVRDVSTYGDYVYSVGDGLHGLGIYDVSQIDDGVVTFVHSLEETAENLAIDAPSGFLYLLGMEGPTVVGAYDLSDPADPTLVGSWPGFAAHAQVVTYTQGKHAGRQIAYIGTARPRGLEIVDVTDKSAMFRIGRAIYPSVTFPSQGWLSADRRYFYLCDVGDERQGEPVTRTMIFDVSDVSNPTYVDFFTTGQRTADHVLYIHEGFAFEANFAGGLHIFDTSNPVSPIEVGYFDTFPSSDDTRWAGAWSTYPFFPSGTVIVSDSVGGLFVLDPSEALRGLIGDVNCDGAVNAFDIEPFLLALFDPDEYRMRHPKCNINRADINGDGAINAFDIEPFLDLLFP